MDSEDTPFEKIDKKETKKSSFVERYIGNAKSNLAPILSSAKSYQVKTPQKANRDLIGLL